MRLLLAEDHIPLAGELMASLTCQGYAVNRLADDRNVVVQGASGPYDLIILDLDLPERPGLEVFQEQRGLGLVTPVLILTARDSWVERINRLKAGAGNYLIKPFHPGELALRIQILSRRAHRLANQSQPETARLRLDEQRQYVCLDGADVDLTATEFRLLRYLMLYPGQALSKGHLAEYLYDGETERDSNVIEVHVSHLRRKLGREVIETRRGQGYRYTGVAAGWNRSSDT